MASIELPPDDGQFVERALQAAIRIGLVLLLVAWCFTIVRPFVVPVVWGIIIAVATYPAFARLQAALGGRRVPAATATLPVFTSSPAIRVLAALRSGPSKAMRAPSVETSSSRTTVSMPSGRSAPVRMRMA